MPAENPLLTQLKQLNEKLTLNQKISDQCRCSVSTPPSTGPPIEDEANTAPI